MAHSCAEHLGQQTGYRIYIVGSEVEEIRLEQILKKHLKPSVFTDKVPWKHRLEK